MPIPATIVEITQASPTTKALRLDTGGNRLSFRPGQWVDFYADGGGDTAVAGYSITSAPSLTGGFELAVKLVGENPVTHYVHQRARVGDVVEVEVGGDFLYTSDMGGPLVLVAGGIGITPLMSIVRYVDESERLVPLTLLYSAKTPDELLFREELEDIARGNPDIDCHFSVTRPVAAGWTGRVGRIDRDMAAAAGVDAGSLFFICGPPPMIADMVRMATSLGAPPSRIKYEGW